VFGGEVTFAGFAYFSPQPFSRYRVSNPQHQETARVSVSNTDSNSLFRISFVEFFVAKKF
jgi:hypothetical protein